MNLITVTVRFPHCDVTYQINRATRDMTSSDINEDDEPAIFVTYDVDDLLETDSFIGPQTGEYTAAWGNWDRPINVVAAFHEAAQRNGGQLLSYDLGGDTAEPGPSGTLADPIRMARQQRLAEAARRWSEWAKSAKTDTSPDDLVADLALPQQYRRRLARRETN